MRAAAMKAFLIEGMLAAALVLASTGTGLSEERIRLVDPWIRHAPPAAKLHAGYLQITNTGHRPRTIIRAESPDYAKIELHASRVVGGIVSMEPVGDLEIAPGQTVSFAPGGLHLMLIGPKRPTEVGGTIALTLVLRDGARLPVNAIVKAGSQSAGQQPHRHDTQHHQH